MRTCAVAGCPEKNTLYTCAWCLQRPYCCHTHQQYDYEVQNHWRDCKRTYRKTAVAKRRSILRARLRRAQAASTGSVGMDIRVRVQLLSRDGRVVRERSADSMDIRSAWARFVRGTRLMHSDGATRHYAAPPGMEPRAQYVVSTLKQRVVCDACPDMSWTTEDPGATATLELCELVLESTRQRR